MSALNLNQPMNGAWIEVFKVGTHTDSSGNMDTWTPEKIDSYLAKYNPAYHEAPVRIDHVEPSQRKAGGPGFGWVEAVKREGNTVYAKLTQVSKQFEDWVRQGLVKKRSIAFDQRYGIHHLAFLGFNCPAVPGMENVYSDSFHSSGGILTIEFESSELKPTQHSGGTVKNVRARDAIDILDRMTREFIDAEEDQGRRITYEAALVAVVEQIDFHKVPNTGGRLFSFFCESKPTQFSAGTVKTVRALEAVDILERMTRSLINARQAKGTDISYGDALMRVVRQTNFCEVPATGRQLFSLCCD